jgi:hypothetical protein
LAAAQGYYPRKGSVAPGDLTTNIEEGIKVSAPDEGTPVPGVESRSNSDGNKTAKDVAAGKSRGGDIASHADKPAVNGSAGATSASATQVNGDELSNGVEKLSVADNVEEVPVAKTTAGAPEGDVVFDHKPSESELKEVRESLDVKRD